MPFNKGDFTQQGVNGHVNATVRLNEKRLVNIDMTSNEEAEGCTIAGTVTDLLNDKVYNIGSAPSGNIEITENTAEPLNIAQYATATVNVSGGGGLNNKKLTINFVESTCTDADITALPILSDNALNLGFPSLSNEDKSIVFIIPADAVSQPWINTTVAFSTFTGSDAVNCQIMEMDGFYAIFVTDPTADASITIKAVAGGI